MKYRTKKTKRPKTLVHDIGEHEEKQSRQLSQMVTSDSAFAPPTTHYQSSSVVDMFFTVKTKWLL